MRLALLTLCALLSCGCSLEGVRCVNPHPAGTDCSYGYGDTTAQAGFGAWDGGVAASGVRAVGTLDEEGAAGVRGHLSSGETITVARSVNGSTLSVTYPHDAQRLGLTSEEAQRAAQPAHEPLFNATLAAFEAATGWRHEGNVTWLVSMSVA